MKSEETAAVPLEFSDYVKRLTNQAPDLAAELADCESIEHVLQWMQGRNLLQTAIDMVAQDEFNYDFLLELEPQGRWLVFGVT